MNQLEQLAEMSTIVIDTGDIDEIKKYTPQDATTNPSLILAAAQKEEYADLIRDAVSYTESHANDPTKRKELLVDKLFVNFGAEILKVVPGRVSTEVDAILSYDMEGSLKKARNLIKLYEEVGVPKERILIKLASTWEGAQASKVLEKEGIHTNMTLMFSLVQAIACADAGATLISPFVGRILDWHKKNANFTDTAPSADPGVKSVTEIFHYYKKFGHKTQVMGASFRNKNEILEIAGCDLITIAPNLMQELKDSQDPISLKLDESQSSGMDIEKMEVDEKTFRWELNNDAMAIEKLSEGIRNFSKHSRELEAFIEKKFLGQ